MMADEYVIAGRRELPRSAGAEAWSFRLKLEDKRSEDVAGVQVFEGGSFELDEIRRSGNDELFAFVEKHAGFVPKSVVTIRKASWEFSRAAAEVVVSALDGVHFVDALVAKHGLEKPLMPSEPAASLKELEERIESASRDATAFLQRWKEIDTEALTASAQPKPEAQSPPEKSTQHIDLGGVHAAVTAVLVAAQQDADQRAQMEVVPAHVVVAFLEAGHCKAVAKLRGLDLVEVLGVAKATVEKLPTTGQVGDSTLHPLTIFLINAMKKLRTTARPVADLECLARTLADRGHLPSSLKEPWTEEERNAERVHASAAQRATKPVSSKWFPFTAVQDMKRELLSRANLPVAATEAARLLRMLERLGDADIPGLDVKDAEHRVELRALETKTILVVEWREKIERLELRLIGVQESAVRQFQWEDQLGDFIDAEGDALTALRELVLRMFPTS
jgi:hypothetical protein